MAEPPRTDLPQHLTVQTSRHRFHFMPDGRKFTGQLAVTAPGIGHAKGHAHREQPCRVDLFYPGLLWVGKIRKDDPAHGAGQLIQQAAWFSEICISEYWQIFASSGAVSLQPYSPFRMDAIPISKAAELESPLPRSTSLAV